MLLTFLTPQKNYVDFSYTSGALQSSDDHKRPFSLFLKFEIVQASIKLAVPDLRSYSPCRIQNHMMLAFGVNRHWNYCMQFCLPWSSNI